MFYLSGASPVSPATTPRQARVDCGRDVLHTQTVTLRIDMHAVKRHDVMEHG